MISLKYNLLCPLANSIRVMLLEKKVEFILENVNFWEINNDIVALNMIGELPILIDQSMVFSDSLAIAEYINDKYPAGIDLIGENIYHKTNVIAHSNWFIHRFNNGVSKILVNEKIIKFYKNLSQPNTNNIRVAKNNLVFHLDYINYLLEENNWISGNSFSYSDIVAACQILILDYLGEIVWVKHPRIKEWYSVIKSRPSFRVILSARVSGFSPPDYFEDLDF